MSLLASIALCAPAWAGVVTVDDDGPAHFADLPAAVAGAQPGDVLLVEPGVYTAPHVDKDLTIMARVPGSVLVGGAGQAFTITRGCHLYGLDAPRLELVGIASRARIDACRTRDMRVTDCADVRIARTNVQSQNAPALRIEDAAVELVACEVQAWFASFLGYGYDGITTYGDVRLGLFGSTVRGGDSLWDPGGFNPPGFAVQLATGQLDLVVRGSLDDVVAGGTTWDQGFRADAFGLGGGTWSVRQSGATVLTAAVPPVPDEPWLRLGPEDPLAGGGGARRVQGFGPAGAALIVALAPASDLVLELGLPGSPLALDLGAVAAIVPLQLVGQDQPASALVLPPSGPAFIGIEVELQGVVLGVVLGSAPFVTNATHLVLNG